MKNNLHTELEKEFYESFSKKQSESNVIQPTWFFPEHLRPVDVWEWIESKLDERTIFE